MISPVYMQRTLSCKDNFQLLLLTLYNNLLIMPNLYKT